MEGLAALVLNDGPPIMVAGLTLTERAVLLSQQAGLDPVYLRGPGMLDAVPPARLSSPPVIPLQPTSDAAALEHERHDKAVVVVGSNVLFGPTLLTSVAKASEDRQEGEAMAAFDAGAPILIYVPGASSGAALASGSIDEMAANLAARGSLRTLPMTGLFGRRVTAADNVPAVEREYIRHLTGKGEGYFTKKIRRFSVPLTTRLVRLGARPTHVTLAGLLLAIASAWLLARGSYAAGLVGALLYYASMILDCSDGEVARVTVREGAFGAWLETVVDYVTYILILAAITTASQTRSDAEGYRVAAWMALVGTVIVIVVAGYLRHRVASADPGQFDDASAKALATASGVHRFARWGRQWIKRSTMAHLLVFLALVNQLPVLLYLWAFGATVASVVILVVLPFVVQRVVVAPAAGRVQRG